MYWDTLTTTVTVATTIVVGWSWFFLYRHRHNIYRLWKVWSTKARDDVHIHNDSITMKYFAFGRPYYLTLPYAAHYRAAMIPLQALLHKQGQNIDITQQEGVPYPYSASELGGEYIQVINHDLDEIYTYVDQAPGYCVEVLGRF